MKQLPAMPPHIQEKFEEEIRVEIIRQQTEEDLRTNPSYQEYFSQFNPASVESFIRNYARRKAFYLTRGQDYIQQEEQHTFRYKLIAEEGLWAIQQKKLFNLQCQWRAEQVKLKGVEHSSQFHLLSSNIQHCPYLSPVSKAEMDLYVSFLRSGNASLFLSYDNWQDYEAFKTEYEAGTIPSIDETFDEHMPAWYRFYDEYMGTSSLLDLPDVRGEKENRYRSIARQRQLESMKRNKQNKEVDQRPYLSVYDTELVESFVRRFEDKKVLKYCRAVESFQQMLDEQLELDDALEKLRNASISVSIKSCSDWKEAIIDAARRYELEQVACILPAVHQEYVFRLENGINFTQSLIDKKREEYAFQICENARKQILEGRSILGEPENLRF
ncbi:MAG: hypothetical protein JNL88_05855 [Bacteroidia bacterium]|nr:hypothetical protein [Bacteroidia bacterium]